METLVLKQINRIARVKDLYVRRALTQFVIIY